MEEHPPKRPYRGIPDWVTFYQERQDAGELIDHKWLVESKLCVSYQAARKLTSRHVKAGILVPEFSNHTPYQSFRISHNSKKVTLSADGRQRYAGDTCIDLKPNFVYKENNDSVLSLQLLPPNTAFTEHTVCNVSQQTPTPSKGAIRIKRYRQRRKTQLTHCSCSDALDACDYCYTKRFLPLTTTAYDALYHSKVHPMLRQNPDPRYVTARDSLLSYPIENHRTYFAFNTPTSYMDPTIPAFATLPGKNHPYRGKFKVGKIRCSYEIYEGGYTVIKPQYSQNPKLPAELHAFKQEILSEFPHWAPAVEKWIHKTADIHLDAPTMEPHKRHTRFNYKGTDFQMYNKNLPGKRRILRLEAQISPGCTIAEYPAFVAKAEGLLREVLGKA